MLLLKITGMALLVAPAMAEAEYCDSLIGTKPNPNTFTEVTANSGDLPGCGASRCKDPNTWVGRVWARKDYCEDNGMRLCTIQELKNGHAQGTGCKFDSKEVWSSSPCSGGRWTYNWVDGTQECRVETYGASIRCCADDAPEPTGTCPFANGMTGHGCPNLMTKSNGSCKTGTIARCVQCSGCDYYKVDQANEQASRSYLRNNPHCARCRKLGKPTAIRKDTDFSGALWSCLQKPSVPAECLSFAKCNAFNYDADERRKCTKFYGL